MAMSMKDILKGLNFGFMQDMINISNTLEKKGLPKAEFLDFVNDYLTERQAETVAENENIRTKQIKQRKDYATNAPKCPTCGDPLMIKLIKEPRGNKNVNGYKSLWYCINDESGCIYEQYSTNNLSTELKKLKKRR